MAKFFMAEDDPLMSRMYERAFRLNGLELQVVADGEAAFTTLTSMNPKPDVVILDVMMPKMSGFDVLQKLKEDQNFSKVPIVLLTNLAGKEDAEKAMAMGANMYLVKSDYNPKQVVEKLQALVPTASQKAGA